MKSVGFIFNPQLPRAVTLAAELQRVVSAAGYASWTLSAWDVAAIKAKWDNVHLLVTLGGDGTILRAARLAAPLGVPIVGVNLGRLGFLAELGPGEAVARLPEYLNGGCWVEERAMLSVVLPADAASGPASATMTAEPAAREYTALNDVFIGRGQRSRMVELKLQVDGAALASFRADGVIVATATGSTAYSLTAGGPVLYPQAKNPIITPVLPFLLPVRSMVLPSNAVVKVIVRTDHQAMLSVDGQVDVPLRSEAEITVTIASYCCRLLRNQPSNYFFETLLPRLGREGAGIIPPPG